MGRAASAKKSVIAFGFSLWLMLANVMVQADIADVRTWQYPDKTRVVLDLTRAHEYKVFELSSPPRIVLDINDAKILKALDTIDLSQTPIKSIRSAKRNQNDIRVVFDLEYPLGPPSTSTLSPNEVYGYRIAIDLMAKSPQAVLSAPPKVVKKVEPKSNKPRDLIIAIDAGHGGEDPGAIGAGRTMEKHVVLAIAKELQQLFIKEPGFTPVMVRTGDYYLGLAERIEKARAAKADFFVSIHADAFKTPTASGSSVYMLSHGGASSTASKWLADKENRSDLIGGYRFVEDSESEVNRVILDLSMTNKRSESTLLGQSILKEMGKITKLHKQNVEEAGFAVLKAPDIPALLVETGFISNPQESRLLSTKAHQKKIANALFNGITAYFEKHNPAVNILMVEDTKSSIPSTYVVQSGDTLSTIASRQGVAMHEIKQINNLTQDALRVGQRLLIPSS